MSIYNGVTFSKDIGKSAPRKRDVESTKKIAKGYVSKAATPGAVLGGVYTDAVTGGGLSQSTAPNSSVPPQGVTPSVPEQTVPTTPVQTGGVQNYAEQLKQSAYEKAEVDYLAAVTDAENRYKQQTNPYGATAARMEAAGLQNTGYADYLTDRAYATKVDEVLAAKAQKAAAQRSADVNYTTMMREEATKKADFYKEMGDVAGMAQSLVAAGTLTPAEASSMIYDGFKSQIDSGTFDLDAAENNHARGLIDDQTYNSLKQYWNDSIIVNDNFFDTETGALPKKEAEQQLAKVSKWLTPEKRAEIEKLYNSKYGNITVADGYQVNRTNFTDKTLKTFTVFAPGYESEDGTLNPNNMFSLKYAGKADSYVQEAAKDISDGTVFVQGDELYVKKNGVAYKTKSDIPGQYKDLKESIKNGRVQRGTLSSVGNALVNGLPVKGAEATYKAYDWFLEKLK